MLTQERLKELLTYDPVTGLFFYRVQRGSKRVGDVAGTITTHGYRQIVIDQRFYRACRLAFLYMEGAFPLGQADHINRNRADDRWHNLRALTHAENQQNCKELRKNNRSGFKGVSWCKKRNRWQAHIQANGKQKNLGVFKTIDEAIAAYRAAEKVMHLHKGE